MKLLYTFKTAILVLVGIAFAKCSAPVGNEDSNTTLTSGKVYLSMAQFETEKMQVANPSIMTFKEGVSVTGKVVAQKDGYAKVSPVLPGKVAYIRIENGDVVTKGEVLARISSPEFIAAQQRYIEVRALKKKTEADYLRAKTLYENKVDSEKEFLRVESEYRLVQSDYQASKLLLEQLHVDIPSIDAGGMEETYPLIAPIGGVIASVDFVLGGNIAVDDVVAEIVDPQKLQLNLSIFANDASNIKSGDSVEFICQKEGAKRSGRVISMSKMIRNDSKSIDCRVEINKDDARDLFFGVFVNATVYTRQWQSIGVPEQALISQAGKSYYFVVDSKGSDNYVLHRKIATTGVRYQGFIEVLNAVDTESIIAQGAYNLPVE